MPKESTRKHPYNRRKGNPNWGGRRPGAGDPRGNMNALKHGRRSVRMAPLGMLMTTNPVVRAALLSIADRWERKQMKAEEVAGHIFEQVLERGLKVADDRGRKLRQATPDDIYEDPSRLSVLPPVTDRRSIETATLDEPPTQTSEEKITALSIKTHEGTPTIDQHPNGKPALINR